MDNFERELNELKEETEKMRREIQEEVPQSAFANFACNVPTLHAFQMMTFNTCTSLTCPTPTSTKANPAAVSSPVLSRVHLQLVQVDGLQHLDLRLDAADKKTAQLVCAAESLRHFITG